VTELSGQAHSDARRARKALNASLTIVRRHTRDLAADVAAVVRCIPARSVKVIPAAEQLGLADEITEWVLHRACRNGYQGRHRRKRRHP
jgi:EAL domain-containing protein (putative c-di-GMP-specific phosphodiesterase class I)